MPPKAAFLERVTRKAEALVEQEMAIFRVRERQRRQLAEVSSTGIVCVRERENASPSVDQSNAWTYYIT